MVWCLMFETPGTKRKLPQHRIHNCILYEMTHHLYLAPVFIKPPCKFEWKILFGIFQRKLIRLQGWSTGLVN